MPAISGSLNHVLSRFTYQQQAFLMALANTGIGEPQPASDIAKLAHLVYGAAFSDMSFLRPMLSDLVETGYINITKTTQARHMEPVLVTPTDRLVTDVALPQLDQLKDRTNPIRYSLFASPSETYEVVSNVKSGSGSPVASA